MKQRFLFLLMVVLASASTWAAVGDEFTKARAIYKVTGENPNTVELIGFETEPTGYYSIPKTVSFYDDDVFIASYTVTSIGDVAFKNCTELTSVNIPIEVTNIGDYAFLGCTGLTEVYISGNVQYIGEDAFYGCENLMNVYLFKYTWNFVWTESGDDFMDGKATRCHVRDDAAGWQTQFPDANVTFVDDLWELDETFTVDDVDYRVTCLWPKAVTVTGYSGSQTALTIPEQVLYEDVYYDVAIIGNNAFKNNTTLTSVTIPGSVTTIGANAFDNCTGLTSLTLPEGVTSIGSVAFGDCSGLMSVTIPASMKSIGVSAFANCTGVEDVYCYADPAKLEWITCDQFRHYENFKEDKATKCHVNSGQLYKFEAYWNTGAISDVDVTFVGDLTTPTLTDSEPYTRTIDANVGYVTYKKTIGSDRVGKYQAWLIPFDFTLTKAILNRFTFYRINMIANSPSPDVEAGDDVWVFLTKMNENDVLHANMPYVYKPLVAVTDFQFTTPTTTLKAPESESILECSTTTDIYTFYAIYQPTAPRSGFDFYYVNIDGGLSYGYGDDSGVTVGPYRWVVRRESKHQYDHDFNYAREMHFYDGEGTTGIEHTLYEGKH
jgi:hypothetical protein